MTNSENSTDSVDASAVVVALLTAFAEARSVALGGVRVMNAITALNRGITHQSSQQTASSSRMQQLLMW